MKRLRFVLYACIAAVAAAGGIHAYASDFYSESASLGEFGTDDTSALDSFLDMVSGMSGVDFDLVDDGLIYDAIASPSPFPVVDWPSIMEDGGTFPESFLGSPVLPGDDIVGDAGSCTCNCSYDYGIELYASYTAYYGSIGSTYLEYMRGYLPKLKFSQHYVGARTDQYTYIFAYGDDLSYNGSIFTGSDVDVITWSTYNTGSFSHGTQASFTLNPGSYLVYSDLSDVYPALSDLSGFTLRQLLYLVTIAALFYVMQWMYDVRKTRRVKREEKLPW